MRNRLLVAAAALMFSLAAAAQMNLATVKGKASDAEGKPIADAQVQMTEKDTGRKYTLKVDKRGEFQSIAIQPGTYKCTLMKDGKEIFNFNGVRVTLSQAENIVNFDLKAEQALAAKGAPGTQKPQLTEAQKKEMEEISKENTSVKGLNEMMAQARTARDAGDTDTAVTLMSRAVQLDANRDLLWYVLGDMQMSAAKKETDRTAKRGKFGEAAVALKKATELAGASTDTKSKENILSYYDALGKAYEGAGKVEESVAAYEGAVKLAQSETPPNNTVVAQAYYKEGAVFTNSNHPDEAIKAFDKATAADPNLAEAYYWKGVALLAKATSKDNKLTAPEGTAEAFNKYLALKPDGPMAEPAKQMIELIGAKVETSFKTTTKTTTKKKSDKK